MSSAKGQQGVDKVYVLKTDIKVYFLVQCILLSTMTCFEQEFHAFDGRVDNCSVESS